MTATMTRTQATIDRLTIRIQGLERELNRMSPNTQGWRDRLAECEGMERSRSRLEDLMILEAAE